MLSIQSFSTYSINALKPEYTLDPMCFYLNYFGIIPINISTGLRATLIASSSFAVIRGIFTSSIHLHAIALVYIASKSSFSNTF